MIFFLIFSDIKDNFFISFEATLFTGIPVIIETTSATLFSETICLFFCKSFSHLILENSNCDCSCFSSSLSSAASSNFCFLIASFFSFVVKLSLFSISLM